MRSSRCRDDADVRHFRQFVCSTCDREVRTAAASLGPTGQYVRCKRRERTMATPDTAPRTDQQSGPSGPLRRRGRAVGVLALATLAPALAVGLATGVAVAPAQAAPAGCTTAQLVTTCTFTYTGAKQDWTVPAGVNAATFTVVGAAGGDAGGRPGGRGGGVSATLEVAPNTLYWVWVGGKGGSDTDSTNARHRRLERRRSRRRPDGSEGRRGRRCLRHPHRPERHREPDPGRRRWRRRRVGHHLRQRPPRHPRRRRQWRWNRRRVPGPERRRRLGRRRRRRRRHRHGRRVQGRPLRRRTVPLQRLWVLEPRLRSAWRPWQLQRRRRRRVPDQRQRPAL